MSNPETISSSDLQDAKSIVQLQEQLKALASRVEIAEESVKELKSDKEKALIWGISLLGAAVMAMGAWIFRVFEKAVV